MSDAGVEELLDVRDEVAVAKHLTAALVLACSAPTLPAAERAALSTLGSTVREQLEAVLVAFDAFLAIRQS